MCPQRNHAVAAALAASLVVSASAVVAQERSDRWWQHWGMGSVMSEGGPGWHSGMGWGREDQIDRIDGRLAYLKAELRIDDKQGPAWDAFADAAKASAETRNGAVRSFEDADEEKLGLPEQLAQRIKFMEVQLTQLKALKQASGELYATLSAEQKKTADEILLPAMELGPHRMWRWMMHS